VPMIDSTMDTSDDLFTPSKAGQNQIQDEWTPLSDLGNDLSGRKEACSTQDTAAICSGENANKRKEDCSKNERPRQGSGDLFGMIFSCCSPHHVYMSSSYDQNSSC